MDSMDFPDGFHIIRGLYTPPHILVGLHPESGGVQMESWSPSTIFSLVATQPNISPESTWSLPGVRLPPGGGIWTQWTPLENTQLTRWTPDGLQMESVISIIIIRPEKKNAMSRI